MNKRYRYSGLAVYRRLDSTEERLQIQPQWTIGSHGTLQVAIVDYLGSHVATAIEDLGDIAV